MAAVTPLEAEGKSPSGLTGKPWCTTRRPLVYSRKEMASLPAICPFWFQHLKVASGNVQDTYWGRVKTIVSGLDPRLLFMGAVRIDTATKLLEIQARSEQSGGEDVASEAELYKAWQVHRWCTDTEGATVPVLGRLAVVGPMSVLCGLLTYQSVMHALKEQHLPAALFRGGNFAAHAIGIAAITMHNSGNRPSGLVEHLGYLFGCAVVAGGSAFAIETYFEEKYVSQLMLKKSRLACTLTRMGQVFLPFVLFSGMMYMAKGQEWSSTHTNPHLNAYDGDGELVHQSDDVGAYAARETAVMKYVHITGSTIAGIPLVTLWEKLRPNRHLFPLTISCSMYLFLFPFMMGLTPVYTSVASRRISSGNELQEAGISRVHYYRGI